jgi:hypothetical protein
LGAELKSLTGPGEKLRIANQKVNRSNVLIAGLLGLFAGLALLGGKRETRYITEGGARDFTRGIN